MRARGKVLYTARLKEIRNKKKGIIKIRPQKTEVSDTTRLVKDKMEKNDEVANKKP